MFTNEQKERYRWDKACPYCGYSNVISKENKVHVLNNDKSTQRMVCKKCKKSWNEIYPIFDIEEDKEID